MSAGLLGPKYSSRQQVLDALAELDPTTPEGIQGFNTIVFGSPLHEGQLRFELAAQKQVNLLSPGNSWGKTEWIARSAVRHCWYKLGLHDITDPMAWLNAEYRGLVASYHYGQAMETFARLDRLYNSKGAFSYLVRRLTRSDPAQVVFANGSILDIGSLKEDGRLIDAPRRNFVFVDEVGQIPNYENVHNSVVYPRTMGVRGRIFLVGTPKPYTDSFVYHIFELGQDPTDTMYFSQEGSVWENSFWPEDERARVRANPKYFLADGTLTPVGRQVIEGKFVLGGGLFFNRLRVARAFSGQYTLPVGYEEGHSYIVAWDLGGRKKNSDATVGMVFDVSDVPWRLVKYTRFEGYEADWKDKFAAIREDFTEYKVPWVYVDVTGSTRDSIQESLEDYGVTVEGVQFGGAQGGKKYNMLRSLQSAFELEMRNREGKSVRGLLSFPDPSIVPAMAEVRAEFDFYVLDDQKLRQDCVMTAAMVAHNAMLDQLPEALYGDVY